METFFVIKYTPLAPVVSELEIPFSAYENQTVYIKFTITRDQPFGLRIYQSHKIRGYDPMTCLILDLDRKKVAAGMHNEEACFGIE